MTYYTPRALSTNRLQQVVSQNAHGFSVGHVLAFDGTDYILALADTAANANVVGMVSLVLTVDAFVISQEGYIANITVATPFTPGDRMYLSETNPGELTTVAPSSLGEVVLPLFDAITTDAGYFAVTPGVVNSPSALTPWTTISVNTALVVNNNYWVDSAVPLILPMPVSMGTSDSIEVACPANGGGFIIDFGVGQVCDFVYEQTSSGGTITLTTTMGILGGSIKINCHTADTGFMVTSSLGNYIVA
jgi:hypothetical protein